ncbi:hypothetical protein MC885_010612, partial [Smutsia gigantea]
MCLKKVDGQGELLSAEPLDGKTTDAGCADWGLVPPNSSPKDNVPHVLEPTAKPHQFGINELENGKKGNDGAGEEGPLFSLWEREMKSRIHFILLFSRQGKLRLQKWYTTLPDKERKKITREIVQIILSRGQRTSSFVDWKELKLVYKRYASLYFCCAVENQDNELLTLEIVHRYVELLDKYFGNVCELDIIFNFEKAYFILDEFIIGGEIQETSKKSAVKAIEDSDMLQE